MNIAEILKYCPKYTKLYSPTWGNVKLIEVTSTKVIKIKVCNYTEKLTSEVCYSVKGECILFPSKNQRDWNKFRLPVKRGDIMMSNNRAFIISDEYANSFNNAFHKYICGIDTTGTFKVSQLDTYWTSAFYIPASEEAKKELFDKMAEAGYKWNADTLELEKIEPKFKEGDILVDECNRLILYTGVTIDNRVQTCADLNNTTLIIYQPSLYDKPISALRLATEEERNKFYSSLVKEGYKYDKEQQGLVKQKFKPFEKVLVRNGAILPWKAEFFSSYDPNNGFPYSCIGNRYIYCIPYEGNEHLINTTKDY